MTTPDERETTRRQLQGLAELARPDSADSSGYVDLSAYSAQDPNWVENALQQSRAVAEVNQRASERISKIDRLAADSMRPVAMESLVDPREVAAAKAQRWQKPFIVASSVCIAALSIAAIVLVALPAASPTPARTSAAAPPPAALAVAPPAPVAAPADPTPAAAPVQAAAPPPAAADAPVAPAATVAATVAVAPKAKHPAAKHKLAPPATGVRTHAASPASAKSVSKSSGGDSLLGAMQQSLH